MNVSIIGEMNIGIISSGLRMWWLGKFECIIRNVRMLLSGIEIIVRLKVSVVDFLKVC